MIHPMTREDQARANHRGGYNCAQAVCAAFAGAMGVSEAEAMALAPRPRTDGGKCGAFLGGRAVLARLRPEAVDAYEQAFTELNGANTCMALVASRRRLGKKCADYAADAARLVEAALADAE